MIRKAGMLIQRGRRIRIDRKKSVMKKVALYTLHYGKEYLAWSIRSVQDAVDAIIITYAPKPSFSFRGELPNPDSETDLRREAHRFAKKPIIWHTGHWNSEGRHREAGIQLARGQGAGLILVVDADEVWDPETASKCLAYAAGQNRAGRWMARFANFWRSWRWMVQDHFTPIRIVDLRHPLTIDAHLEQDEPIFHFGYAQSEAVMRYKWTIHGHQAELRAGWIDKFIAWTPESTDLHPCVNNLWPRAVATPETVRSKLLTLMGDHPYAHVDVIRDMPAQGLCT